MNKEERDKLWKSFPKEFRKELQRIYRIEGRNPLYNKGYNSALEYLFGRENLTYSEEDKNLSVKEYLVQDKYRDAYISMKITDDPETKKWGIARVALLYQLFGDKCIPDDLKPKFKVGETVYWGNIALKITNYDPTVNQPYELGGSMWVTEGEIVKIN